jgi:hypothetical protein
MAAGHHAVVIVASLAAWLIAVYLSDREPHRHHCAGAGSSGEATDAAAAGSITAAVASEHQPARKARSQKAVQEDLLDRDRPVQHLVIGEPDPAHAAAAQQRLQAETPRH